MLMSLPVLLASQASVRMFDANLETSPDHEPHKEGSAVTLVIQDDVVGVKDASQEDSRANSCKSRDSNVRTRVVDSAVGFDTDLETEEERDDFDLTGAKIYSEACRELGVVPVSYFVRNIRRPDLALRHHGLGPLGAKALAVPLVSNTVVNSLDLEDNWIESTGAIYIADMLKENCYISQLNLANNRIGSPACKALCEMLLINTTLINVNLSGNGFQDKDGQLFAQVILQNNNMKHLNLSHNSFGDKSGNFLGNAIGENETLETLDISWNNFSSHSSVKIVDGIQVNSRLKQVNLSWNGLGPDGAVAVSNCLRNNSILTELDVSSTRILPEGAAIIGDGLKENETLQVFKAGQNLFGSQGALMLLASIHNERSILTELDLSEVWVEKDFIKLQKEMEQSRTDLVVRTGGIVGNYIIAGVYNKSKERSETVLQTLCSNESG